jgi:hypothetical protein
VRCEKLLECDDNMSGTTAGINVTTPHSTNTSHVSAMPIQLVIPPPQSRIVKEGWVYKRGFLSIFSILTLN